ncbi:3-methyladenine DNA glycosylase [Phlyctochytrium bullatum]|nr:3-methyladenine DNA glycosylase [Phlyctochytrium bullatum]
MDTLPSCSAPTTPLRRSLRISRPTPLPDAAWLPVTPTKTPDRKRKRRASPAEDTPELEPTTPTKRPAKRVKQEAPAVPPTPPPPTAAVLPATTATDPTMPRPPPPHRDTALAHLRAVDPRFAPLLERLGPGPVPFAKTSCPTAPAPEEEEALRSYGRPGCAFRALCSSIVYQQLSGAVAKVILDRFVRLFCGDGPVVFPLPADVAAKSVEELRSVGLSGRKAEYVKNLAEAFVNGEVETGMLETMAEEEIVERLVKIKGIGRWTVDMFLIFFLSRPNVLATGDLGVRKGMAVYFGKGGSKLPSPKEMEEWARPWEPYRSYGTWYMWRVMDLEQQEQQQKRKPSTKVKDEKP